MLSNSMPLKAHSFVCILQTLGIYILFRLPGCNPQSTRSNGWAVRVKGIRYDHCMWLVVGLPRAQHTIGRAAGKKPHQSSFSHFTTEEYPRQSLSTLANPEQQPSMDPQQPSKILTYPQQSSIFLSSLNDCQPSTTLYTSHQTFTLQSSTFLHDPQQSPTTLNILLPISTVFNTAL